MSREDPTPLSVGSVWHWGSCAKALTNTTIACVLDSELRCACVCERERELNEKNEK